MQFYRQTRCPAGPFSRRRERELEQPGDGVAIENSQQSQQSEGFHEQGVGARCAPVSDGADQRKYARIEANIACTVATSVDAFEAEIANLSKSGAGVLGPPAAAKVSETITLMLERVGDLVSLAVPGQVVRTEERGERMLYGVAFSALPPDQEAQLVELLQYVSSGKGTGRRTHPRVAARVEVGCRTEGIFRGMLNDLSRGGLSVKTLRDVEPGETMTVSFGVPGLKDIVEVTGEVVSSQKLPHGFRISVQFKPLNETDRAQIEELLDALLGVPLVEAEVVPEGE